MLLPRFPASPLAAWCLLSTIIDQLGRTPYPWKPRSGASGGHFSDTATSAKLPVYNALREFEAYIGGTGSLKLAVTPKSSLTMPM